MRMVEANGGVRLREGTVQETRAIEAEMRGAKKGVMVEGRV